MTKPTYERIWIDPELKRKIKIGAAQDGTTINDFLKKKIDIPNPMDQMQNITQKKRGKNFDFPF